MLTSASLISPPTYDQDYILYISASTFDVAGVLVQDDDDREEHVVYYISKQLSRPALKYSHDKKLALAVVHSVQKLHHYILLLKKKVVTNSNRGNTSSDATSSMENTPGGSLFSKSTTLSFPTPRARKY